MQIDIGLSDKIASLLITGVPEAVIGNATPHMCELMRELMKLSLLRIQSLPPDIISDQNVEWYTAQNRKETPPHFCTVTLYLRSFVQIDSVSEEINTKLSRNDHYIGALLLLADEK